MVNMVPFIKNKKVTRLSPLDIILETTTVRKHDRLYTRVYSMLLANWTRPQAIVQWHFHHYLLCITLGGFLRTLSVESGEAARLNKLGVNYLKLSKWQEEFFCSIDLNRNPFYICLFSLYTGVWRKTFGLYLIQDISQRNWNNFVQSL